MCMHVRACVCVCSVVSDCDPMDCSLRGFPVHGIFQARILKWIAIFYSMESSRPRDRTRVVCLLHWQVDSLPQSHLGYKRGK